MRFVHSLFALCALSACTTSIVGPSDVALPSPKADGAGFDWSAVIERDRPFPVQLVIQREIAVDFAVMGEDGTSYLSSGYVSGQPSNRALATGEVSCRLESKVSMRASAGAPYRLASIFVEDSLGTLRTGVALTLVDRDGLDELYCERRGDAQRPPTPITYADVRDALGSFAALVPVVSRDGTIVSTTPVQWREAQVDCWNAGYHMPSLAELEIGADRVARTTEGAACVWSSELEADGARARAFRPLDGAASSEPTAQAACVSLCSEGIFDVLWWGAHRATIERVLRFDIGGDDALRPNGERVLLAERDLAADGFTHVIDAVLDESGTALTLHVYYATDAIDRCARVRVAGQTDGLRTVIDDVSTELDTACGPD